MTKLSDLARFGVTSLFGAEPYARGMQQRQDADQQRTRNRLLDLKLENAPEQIQRDNRLADLGIQKAEQGVSLNEQKLRSGELDSDLENARLFIGALGSDFEQLDPESQRRQWSAARQRVIGIDPSNEDIPEMPERSAYRLIRGMAGLVGAKGPETTGFLRELEAAGIDPRSQEGRQLIRGRYSKKGTTVNVNTSQPGGASEKKFSEALGAQQAKRYDQIIADAQGADGRIAQARELIEILDGGFETGPRATVMKPFQWAGEVISPGSTDYDKYNRFQQITAPMVKALREPGEGPMSDADLRFMQQAAAGVGNSVEANRLAAHAVIRAEERKEQYAMQAERWVRDNGSLDGFQESWDRYTKANPLFETSEGDLSVDDLVNMYSGEE
ncbi:hypothetical protein [Alloalcanivorax gelatiniphagus]|uniref:Uncharacterized protein n=1 Tax=Alloalcanivorax gelatiniphagus TaxID=1194167 RepID=A0ABY2XMZ3_9GAMM|nr:hypothetical protein [Alloalcanivorax gelatiniphagus]TMW13742.1 hypothetical protein FGS76_06340 [Alloalcanivorax gelatiniphagus]